MESRGLIILVASCLLTFAQAQYIPPDLYDEDYNKAIGFWENKGQITDPLNNLTDVEYYSEGGFPRAYLRDKSLVSFTVAHVDTNIATTDTIYRLDMWPHGSGAQDVSPLGVIQKDWHQSFYMAHCGSSGVTDVLGYNRVVYEDIYDDIDMHFYSGGKGQKLAFVMRPGCNISDLKLAFAGQDSIVVDLWGNLKLYYDDKWMVIPFVQAYQVDGNGTVVPVNWMANYMVDNGTGVVGFEWENYNPAWPLVFQIGIPPFGPSFYDEPGLCWSTYMGGNENDNAYESVEDENGNLYIAGTTGSTFMSFPPVPGTNYSIVGTVAYMMRFNTDDDIEWKTFFAGNALGETTRGTAIGHKVDGELYLAGYSDSESLPVFQPIGGVEFFQGSATGPDYKGFIGRFDKLTGEREWASYYGQNDVFINGMDGLDGKKIFIVGSTRSTIPDLDVSPPVGSTYWPYGSSEDGFVAMFNDDDQHAWRTHIPGTANDPAYDVDANSGWVAVSGMSHSDDLPLVPYGNDSYSVGRHGLDDCYLYEFDENGKARWSTYVGSAGFDFSFHNGVALDPVTKDIVLVGGGGLTLDVVPGPGWHLNSVPPGSSPGFIARFSGVDRSRTWHTYVHNGTGSSAVDLISCAFDPSGKLLVAGAARDAGTNLLYEPLPGLYDQGVINPDIVGATSENKDPVVLVFGVNNEFLYGSYYGGEANAVYRELIFNILHRNLNGNIYLVGVTSKEADPFSYFPLDDGGGVPYFEELWQGGNQEGFLAAICGEALNAVGVAEPSPAEFTLSAKWVPDGLLVRGLPPGVHRYSVLDATGRIVAQGSQASNGTGFATGLPPLAHGAYMFEVQGVVARFVVTR